MGGQGFKNFQNQQTQFLAPWLSNIQKQQQNIYRYTHPPVAPVDAAAQAEINKKAEMAKQLQAENEKAAQLQSTANLNAGNAVQQMNMEQRSTDAKSALAGDPLSKQPATGQTATGAPSGASPVSGMQSSYGTASRRANAFGSPATNGMANSATPANNLKFGGA
jgi:hypothetical protein